jgi:hypothetical protein
LAIIPASGLLVGAGCSGINASGSVSPATFFLPGVVQAHGEPLQTAGPVSVSETAPLLAQSH